jgi:exosortase
MLAGEPVETEASATVVARRLQQQPPAASPAKGEGTASMDVAWWVAIAVVAVACAPFVRQLVHLWRVDPYAGHGIFVPLYSAFLLWSDRERLRALPRQREARGALVVTAALLLLAAGGWLGSVVLQGLALVMAVAGLVLWGHGARRLRAAAFPVFFLVFMMPLPRLVVRAVGPHMQAFAAAFSGAVLSLLGIPHHQYGITLELPRLSLEVAEGCNGLRFLMALVTLAAALAQATQRTTARKAALVALAVPLAVFANGCRVAAVCLAAYYIGPHTAVGMPHHSIGKGVWVLTLTPLVLAAIALRRTGPPDRSAG